jgi:ABC-type lipoprotein export system ATPase subunit
VNEPPLLLADEPTGNLESAAGREILEAIRRLNRARGVTVLLATHSREAAGTCRRIVRMKDGALVDPAGSE